MTPQLQVSAGQNAADITAGVESLQAEGWTFNADSIALEKKYYFKTYTKVADMHHVVATRVKSENHHPVMTTDRNSLNVVWTTHNPRGLSEKDLRMAKYCDEQARHIGTVEPSAAPRCGDGTSVV